MNKLLAAVLLAFLIQVISAQTVDDLVNQYEPQINSRQKSLGLNIEANGKQIGEAYAVLDLNLRNALLEVNAKLAGLNDLINTSVTKAKEGNKDVTECITAEKATLNLLDLGQIQRCRRAQGLITSSIKLSELGKLQRDLGNLLSTCILATQQDTTQIKPCLDDELKRIDNAAANVNREIKSLIRSSSSANKCINDAKNNVQNGLSKAGKDLEVCINGILQS